MGLWFLILGHSLRRLPAFSGEREQADECPLAGARGYARKAKNQHCGDGPEPIARPCSHQSLRKFRHLSASEGTAEPERNKSMERPSKWRTHLCKD